MIRLVLFMEKVPKTIQGKETRYRSSSRKFCFHPAQTVFPLKIYFCSSLSRMLD